MFARPNPHRSCFVRLICALLLTWLLSPATINAQVTKEKPLPGDLTTGQQLNQLESELRDIRKSVDRLEAKLDRLLANPSDFSRVIIRVQSDASKPLAGFQAKLTSQAKEGRHISVSGTSDEDGLAVERAVPYGKYDLSLEEPSGWSTYMYGVVVEIGKDLELDIVAPDPSSRAEIVLISKLKQAAFTGLPFGEVREQMGSGYAVSFTAEPSQKQDSSKSFPTIENGLVEVGARISVSAMQELKQSEGENLTWRWSSPNSRDASSVLVLLASGEICRLHGMRSVSVRPREDGPFFTKLETGKSIGFQLASEVEQLGSSYAIDVPAKQVEVAVTSVVGKASPAVSELLGKAKTESAWLIVNLQQDSQWLNKLFELDQWKPGDAMNTVIKRSLQLSRGAKTEVALASP